MFINKYVIPTLVVIWCMISLLFLTPIQAKQTAIVDLFYSPTCPHCAIAQTFLDKLQTDNPHLVIREYEISKHTNELIDMYAKYKVPATSQGLVPVLFVADKYYVGFDEKTAEGLREYATSTVNKSPTKSQDPIGGMINVPLIGQIDTRALGLPLVAAILGALDGFNVCSLGALLIILALVLTLKSRSKTLVYGGVFIATTAFVYGALIFFWYQLFRFITPYLRHMELVIGVLTIGGGIYFFKQFVKFRTQGPTCSMGPVQKIEGRFSRQFQTLIDSKAKTVTVIVAILLFSVVVTIVEFPCSAAVPVAFAGMLTKAHLTGWVYLGHIALYVLFYMLDELIVFLVAFFTMKMYLTSPKMITWITLAESLILFALGVYYLVGTYILLRSATV